MPDCDQELCPNWSGDGNVCPCALFDLDRDDVKAAAWEDATWD